MPKTSKASIKTSIRLALTDGLRDAFELLKKTRFPFLKEDEILKLAFSQLYASEQVISSKQTSVSNMLAKLRSKVPDFGKTWMQKNSLKEEDMDVNAFADMIISLSGEKEER